MMDKRMKIGIATIQSGKGWENARHGKKVSFIQGLHGYNGQVKAAGFGGGMKMCPEALPGDGLFDVVTIGEVPAEFSRPEVLEVLRAYYASLAEHEKVEVKLSGHSAR